LENYVSPYSATVIEKLDSNYLIPIGATNLDEFAMGSSTENSAFFTTKNPWNTDYVPGGSSGGSAAAVAAGFAPLALGSDTGGSIRQPASFCGVLGLKPTYGRVSRYGLVAFASSLDQIGPFARNVEDCAQLLNVICGFDNQDSTSSKMPVPDFSKALNQDIASLKIGLPAQLFNDQIDVEVKTAIMQALDLLKQDNVTVESTQLDSFNYALASYYIIAPAEASANLARFDGVRYGFRDKEAKTLREMYKKSRGQGFGEEVKRRIIIGTFVLSSGYYDAYYLKAQKVRTLIQEDFARAFAKYDVLITPTCPTPPFKIGECSNDPLKMYLADIATIPVNLAGLPAISVPCGFSKEGLPIGLQIIAKPFAEETLFKLAHRLEQLGKFNNKLAKR
jgi:aspartyl-tRNA(Asn)/glutamyl-tRNA(Gln) amidotransferase subunit A